MKTTAATLESSISNATTLTDMNPEHVAQISEGLNGILADVFALYLKTKSFHWHLSGPHFREYHLLLEDHASQLFAITDEIAERVRKIGGSTLRSIGHIARLQSIQDNDTEGVEARSALCELLADEKALVRSMVQVHDAAAEANDVATASLLENWIDQSQTRGWFLFETTRL